MADFTQSAEELLTKLDTYREQLAQVEEALEQQPDEPSLVKLKNDLTEVIVLTEDLVKYQAAAPTEAEQAAEAGRASAGPLPTRTAVKSVHTALVGRTCEAFFEQKWYNAEIKSVRRDDRGVERCTVDFIGFSNTREFKVTDVRLLRPPHPAQCQPGTRCQAIFYEDGLWYDCIITEQTEKGYKVTFTDYGTRAEVRFDQIRLQSSGKVQDKKRTIKEVVTPAGYKIPESLAVQKTDTEEVIETKKRKIQAIKKQQRTDRLESESQKQQSGWLKFFYNKASTKSKCGFLSGKPKESIFKVPETLEGKVGVISVASAATEKGPRLPQRRYSQEATSWAK
jgi:survival of motor neuron-related-splicing factor 30